MRLDVRSTTARTAPAALALALLMSLSAFSSPALAQTPATPPATGGTQDRKPQARPHSKRVPVDPATIRVGDGDTVEIRSGNESEIVRILGIDTPETRNPEHDLPYSQSFGEEAKAFARGAFATATKVELLRADTMDPYGRTLGYLFLNDRNYSVLVVSARLAVESVTRYGDNGFPEEAKTVAAAAKAAGPVPFEPPGDYRRRMRDLSKWMKEQGSAVQN
jgi:micrococcal nuclease